jgi:hypothetical protein
MPAYGRTVALHPGDNIPRIAAVNPANALLVIVAETYRLTEPITPKNGDRLIG